ncbi:hypothetical protein ES703_86394 [subsurface metagenome]
MRNTIIIGIKARTEDDIKRGQFVNASLSLKNKEIPSETTYFLKSLITIKGQIKSFHAL